ncbi:MAG: flagellar protein FlaG [Lachnospiraceae bacterium]|nr:flagellar protein FlaG [Lachnospiraceae bacterium]
MYIEAMSNTVPAVSAAAVRTVSETEAAKSVKAESTDGNTQSVQPDKKDVAAVYGKQKSDIKLPDEKKSADNEQIRKTIENIKAQLPNSEVKFGIHEKTDRVTIKLVDKKTKEVIKEFPPEKTLDMIAKCMELAGMLVDEKL